MDLYCYKRKFIGNLALTEITPCYPSEAMPPIFKYSLEECTGEIRTPLILTLGFYKELQTERQSCDTMHSSNEYQDKINNFKEPDQERGSNPHYSLSDLFHVSRS